MSSVKWFIAVFVWCMASAGCASDFEDVRSSSNQAMYGPETNSKNNKLILEKYSGKVLCDRIQDYLESNLFDSNENEKFLSGWREANFQKNESSCPSPDCKYGSYIYEKNNEDEIVIVRMVSSINSMAFQKLFFIKKDKFKENFIYIEDDLFSKSDQVDPVIGHYKLWDANSDLGVVWLDYFNLGEQGYILFKPNEYSKNQNYYLVSTVSKEKTLMPRGVYINKVDNQCLFFKKTTHIN